jgi:hypothetical protein
LTLTYVSSANHRSPGACPGKPGRVGRQRHEPPHPPEHGDVADLGPTLDQQLLNVATGQIEPQVPAHRDDDHLRRKTGTRLTPISEGNHRPERVDDFTAQVCLQHANAQRNSPECGRWLRPQWAAAAAVIAGYSCGFLPATCAHRRNGTSTIR